ncbi:helix-turn-helix domain-containing protein [Desulfofustis glycolicus]|uniref:helix-turn-helix domain-containing protein n=1 Tax=Desulfofustis glycolicus TaxID=51195 RepID=UPI003CC5D7D5
MFGIHKHTVRRWVKEGLPVVDSKRPMLILGHHLKTFLQERRKRSKRPCRPGQLYCVRCRSPKYPAAGMAEYQPTSDTLGNLVAICPDCMAIMNRRISQDKISYICRDMALSLPQHLRHLIEWATPTVNSDFN